ncbi:MAG: aminotransferase class III-fold pyridoxal phosphate-dependent enzyme [Chloroflexi bacterium]|nr:aminotransferase class III-fold pyridoxal phosphate-dependent enzyme [Chloroflexota bacterium]MCL5108683.1 aminotransferase class III-fold pyridoxal phosphate-dependent enzyme [Chloroflexota bacterium]
MDAKTTRTQEYAELIQHYIVDFRQMAEFCQDPLVMKTAEGIRYQDVDGRTWLDGISGVFVVNTGHGNQFVLDAIKAALDNKLTFSAPLHSTNVYALELVRLLLGLLPEHLTVLKFCSEGSVATEMAMKMARQYHQQTGKPRKHKVISRYLSFHGVTADAQAASGLYSRKAPFEPGPPGHVHVAPHYCYHCPYGLAYPACDVLCARFAEQIIEWEGPETVSAFIADPVMFNAGVLAPPKEYFPIIRSICDKYDVLLIYDEIITGFGRTGAMFAADTYQTVPDILVMGKGITGGYAPLAGMAIRDRVAAAFWGELGQEFADGHTYGGNPIACAAAHANITYLLQNDVIAHGRQMGDHLMERLRGLYKYRSVGDVRGQNLLVGVEFVKDRATREPFPAAAKPAKLVERLAREKGLILRANPEWFCVAPPLIIAKQDIDVIADILDRCVGEAEAELAAAGYL